MYEVAVTLEAKVAAPAADTWKVLTQEIAAPAEPEAAILRVAAVPEVSPKSHFIAVPVARYLKPPL